MTRLAVNASLRRVAAPAGVAAAVTAVGGALVVLGPGVLVPFRCPFLALTGLACPFCGGTRGAAALARGDLVVAFGLNALTTVLLLGVAVLWVGWLVARVRGQRVRLDARVGVLGRPAGGLRGVRRAAQPPRPHAALAP